MYIEEIGIRINSVIHTIGGIINFYLEDDLKNVTVNMGLCIVHCGTVGMKTLPENILHHLNERKDTIFYIVR